MPITTSTTRKPRRPRAARACERCRIKKYKCDESIPCIPCKKSRFECVVEGTKLKEAHVGSDLTAWYIEHIHIQESRIQELAASLQAAQSALVVQQTTIPLYGQENGPFFRDERSSNLRGAEEAVAGCEITEVNYHTNAVEYHGNTSSLATLGQVQKECLGFQQEYAISADEPSALVSAFHNPGFSPHFTPLPREYSPPAAFSLNGDQAVIFMDGYFDTLHLIHPIIDKEDFTTRANDLRAGRMCASSFVALYYSVLALGALVRVWDEQQILGMTRFDWSRKLFKEARDCLDKLEYSNDVDVVQCLVVMALTCQNELNPTLAYKYLGQATRACLSAGFNREPSDQASQQNGLISNIWWGIYSLEIELSFSLGRPDSLGVDDYHNRHLPELHSSESGIINCMVPFSQILRKVAVHIYLSKAPWQEKLQQAGRIQDGLDAWVETLPAEIKPDTTIEGCLSQLALREPKWSRRQRLSLRLRYYNAKALLFRPFLSHVMLCPGPPPPELLDAVRKCSGAARKTIEIIHETFRVHDFFRTWWYNSTYILSAASILLLHMVKCKLPCPSPWVEANIKVVEMAIELLEAMDESVVAKRAAELLKKNLTVVKYIVVGADYTAPPSYDTAPLHHLDPQYLEQELDDKLLFSGIGMQEYFPQDVAQFPSPVEVSP